MNALISGRTAAGAGAVTVPVQVDSEGRVVTVAGGSGGGSVPVTSPAYLSIVPITRPANTTGYTAGDAWGPTSAILELASIGPSGGHVLLTDLDLRIDLPAIPSGMTSFRLHLYYSSPDAIADNAVWVLSSTADKAAYIGFIDLGSPAVVGSVLFVQALGQNRQVKLGTGSTSLYGVLVTNGAYTPTSGAVASLRARSIAI